MPYIIIIVFLCCSLPVLAEKSLFVTVKPLQQLLFQPVKKVPARVVSLQSSLLSAEIAALVDNVHVQIGDRVLKNQLLVTLDCSDYKLAKQLLWAEKKALNADYDFALYQYQRSKKLIKTNSVSQEAHRHQASDVIRLEAQQQLLEIKIQQAEKNISRCAIKAPFAGVIAKRLINIGENVAPRSPLIRLIDIENLEVEVQVPLVLVDDLDYSALNFIYRKQSYPLKIRAIIPAVETRARHQKVRLSFIAKKTLPDAYGMVEITLREKKIPANYLVKRNNKNGIFLVNNSTPEHLTGQFHALKNALPGRAAVIDLPINSRIIIAGRHALHDGQYITIEQ